VRQACNEPRHQGWSPRGGHASDQAIAVGPGSASAPGPGRTDPGQDTPRKGVRRFTSHAQNQVTTPTLPASPRPATQRLTGASQESPKSTPGCGCHRVLRPGAQSVARASAFMCGRGMHRADLTLVTERVGRTAATQKYLLSCPVPDDTTRAGFESTRWRRRYRDSEEGVRAGRGLLSLLRVRVRVPR
jgi:hypothetical protein